MIVLDANLLLYASDPESIDYRAARSWVESVMNGPEWIGLPWQTIHAFLRIATNPRLLHGGAPMEKAVEMVNQWIGLRNVRLLVPGEHYWTLLQRVLREGQVKGPLTTDAQLAALTLENGGVLYSTDRDFARFPGLRWVNPLAKS